jgi:hypothetical protein
MNFLEESGIEVLEWPPQLPDLNPIEHLWEAVDRSLRLSRHQANGRRNLDQLFHCLQEAWQSIPDNVLFITYLTPCQHRYSKYMDWKWDNYISCYKYVITIETNYDDPSMSLKTHGVTPQRKYIGMLTKVASFLI